MRGFKSAQGSILLEVIAAIGLIAAAVVGAMTVMANHSIATRSADAGDTAINLVKTQLEDIKNATYCSSNTYSTTVTPPAGYTVTINVSMPIPTATPGSAKLQQVKVTAAREGTTYLSIDTYKANLSGTTTTASPPC